MADSISPGDVRTFRQGDGRSLVVGLGLWVERQGKWLHIHMTGPDRSHTTVTNNPESERYHRTLFRNLRRTLIKEKCWVFGGEGNETENEVEEHFAPVPVRNGRRASEIIIAERGE